MFNLKSASISKKMIMINAPIIFVLVVVLFIIISIYASKSAENSAKLSIEQAGYSLFYYTMDIKIIQSFYNHNKLLRFKE